MKCRCKRGHFAYYFCSNTCIYFVLIGPSYTCLESKDAMELCVKIPFRKIPVQRFPIAKSLNRRRLCAVWRDQQKTGEKVVIFQEIQQNVKRINS